MIFIVDTIGRSWALASGVHVSCVALLVNCPLVFALHELELVDDSRSIDCSLDALVVVDQGPEYTGGVGLDLWVLVLSTKECHEAGQEAARG